MFKPSIHDLAREFFRRAKDSVIRDATDIGLSKDDDIVTYGYLPDRLARSTGWHPAYTRSLVNELVAQRHPLAIALNSTTGWSRISGEYALLLKDVKAHEGRHRHDSHGSPFNWRH